MPKHRQFTPEFKTKVVLEIVSGQKSAAERHRVGVSSESIPAVLHRADEGLIERARRTAIAGGEVDDEFVEDGTV